MNGNGIFVWPDKKKYIGSYKNDNKHGYGIFNWPDGRKYEGCWSDGKQHGFGILLNNNSDGKKYGEWKEGKKVRLIKEEDDEEIRKVVQDINKQKNEYNFHEIEKFIFSTDKTYKNFNTNDNF